MSSFAAECRWAMPNLSYQQKIASQIARQKATLEKAPQNEALIRATYGIGQFLMGIFGLKDIPRNSLPFPTR